MRQIETRGRLLQKEKRKRIYLITIINWSIRTSKKKTIADIFRLTDRLPYLSESSCHSILDFPFLHLLRIWWIDNFTSIYIHFDIPFTRHIYCSIHYSIHFRSPILDVTVSI